MATLTVDLPMEAIAALCREYHVLELSIFGSALRNDFREDSDLDLLVLFDPDAGIGFLELAALPGLCQSRVGVARRARARWA